MPEFAAQTLLRTPTVTVRDVYCQGSCRHQGAEECASATELVFPYRGVYVRHLGEDQAVAEANQVLFFNAAEGYRISHPLSGGDASLSLAITEPLLSELVPPAHLRDSAALEFQPQRLRIEAHPGRRNVGRCAERVHISTGKSGVIGANSAFLTRLRHKT
jgi:hypothetical protein